MVWKYLTGKCDEFLAKIAFQKFFCNSTRQPTFPIPKNYCFPNQNLTPHLTLISVGCPSSMLVENEVLSRQFVYVFKVAINRKPLLLQLLVVLYIKFDELCCEKQPIQLLQLSITFVMPHVLFFCVGYELTFVMFAWRNQLHYSYCKPVTFICTCLVAPRSPTHTKGSITSYTISLNVYSMDVK